MPKRGKGRRKSAQELREAHRKRDATLFRQEVPVDNHDDIILDWGKDLAAAKYHIGRWRKVVCEGEKETIGLIPMNRKNVGSFWRVGERQFNLYVTAHEDEFNIEVAAKRVERHALTAVGERWILDWPNMDRLFDAVLSHCSLFEISLPRNKPQRVV